ncbi:MAG: SusC/RagA family TonB-linked outer membrane protein [Bacteroidales bacterium]|nr:SusC/RagA family TonB-linked outer membrane protein [Bacteroidales bacterium]
MTKRIFSFSILIFTSALFLMQNLSAQNSILVKGIVVNDKNEAVPGIAISIEGVTGAPEITDENGEFSISSEKDQFWLFVSPVNLYKSKKVFIDNTEFIKIRLSSLDLTDGYDEIIDIIDPKLRRNFIGSQSTIDLDNIRQIPYQTTDQFLASKVAGLYSVNHSGMPGDGAVSYLRGIKSLNTNNQPLFIIDGLPLEEPGIFNSSISGHSYNPLSSLDPADITNITVLKDFSRSALYGMRGSNGVVLIETLKPTEVQTSIDFSMRTGIGSIPRFLPQLDNNNYKTYAKEVLLSSGMYEEDFPELFPGLYMDENSETYYMYNNDTRWQEEIYSQSVLKDIFFKIRGGDEIAKYGLSVGYLDHEGVISTTDYTRFNIRFVGTFNIFQWLKMYISSNLSTNTAILKESGLSTQTSPVLTSLRKNPLMIPYQFDDSGNQLIELEDVEEFGVSNPLATIDLFEATHKNYRFLTSFRIEGEISPSLKINSVFGLNSNAMKESIFLPNLGMELYFNKEAYNAFKSFNNYLGSFSNDNYLSYNKDLSPIQNITASLGIRGEVNKFQEDWGISMNSNENDEYRSLQSGTSYLRQMGGFSENWNRMAIYSSVNYTLLDKYMAGVSVSTENSTRIGLESDNTIFINNIPFGVFYSASLAWRISSEDFFNSLSMIDDMKVRMSYGKAGNDDIGNYNALNYYVLTHYRESTGMIPGAPSDQKLSYESYYQMNAGLDLAMYGNRLRLNFDMYSNRTEDMLTYDLQTPYIGYEYIPINDGTHLNKGIEVNLQARPVSGRIKWDIGLNFSIITSEVTELLQGDIITAFEGGEFITSVGNSLLNFYGYNFEGVLTTTEDANNANLVNSAGIPFMAGDAKFTDISGPEGTPDGVINIHDKTIIGSPLPEMFFGLTNNFKYGKWSLETSLQLVYGNEIFNYIRYQNEKMSDLSNQSTNVLQRWHYEGQNTTVPRASFDDPVGNSDFSSRWIEDGSYIRLKDITLAYTIPDKFLAFRNAQLFVTGTNLLTLTRYLGYDPELSYSFSTVSQGIDYGLTPQIKTIVIGFKVGL